MQARYVVLTLAAVALAFALWLFRDDEAAPQGARPSDSSSADAASDVSPLSPVDPVAPVERTSVDPSAARAELAASAARAKAVGVRGTTRELAGTLAVERADGSKIAAPDGEFTLIAWCGPIGTDIKVPVRNGRWRVRFADKLAQEIERAGFRALRVGDRWAVLRAPSEPVALPARSIELLAYFPPATLLRVVAADSGAELGDVELVTRAGFPNNDDVHPGLATQGRVLAEHQTSPIDVSAIGTDRDLGIRQLLVRAPGYAWSSVTLDTRTGGDRFVRLERGGDLRLRLVGNRASSGVHVRFRRAVEGSKPVLSIEPDERAEVVFAGLAAGEYSIRAEVGEWFHTPLELGQVEVTIVANQEAQATLSIAPAPRAEVATAGGVVIVPAAWHVENLMLRLKLLDTPLEGREANFNINTQIARTQANGAVSFEWMLNDLQVGRYELDVQHPPAIVVIDLPRGGKTDFRLELAPPAELAVRVVDEATGDDVTVDKVLWTPQRPAGVSGGGLKNADLDPETRRFIIRAPQGAVEVSVWGGAYEQKSDVVMLMPGQQEHTVRVRCRTAIEIVLRDGETPVPFPSAWRATIETMDGKPASDRANMSVYLRRYSVPATGRYKVKLPPINGFQPIADQMVDAELGKTVKLEVALTKAP